MKLSEAVIFNPPERLPKGTFAKKVSMDKLQPFVRDIPTCAIEPYGGGAKFRNGDTIMARITPCLENGKTALVSFLKNGEVGYGSTEFIVWRARDGVTDSNYVYYLSQSPEIRDVAVKSMVGSSGRQRVQQSVLDNCEIDLPDLDTQREIAATLSALDDKIANNTKINHHLEQMAQAIWSERFGRCEPNGMLGDYCTIKSGFAFKSPWWQDDGVKVLKIKNITYAGLDLSDCSFVSDDKVALAKEFIARTGDLLIAMTGATIGKFAIVPQIEEILLVNQRVGKFFFRDAPVLEWLPFLWCILKQDSVFNEIINRGQGSAQPNISPTDIMTIPIFMPAADEIAEFNEALQSSFETITANAAESEKLALLRDTLLPRLMSGETTIDIANKTQYNDNK